MDTPRLMSVQRVVAAFAAEGVEVFLAGGWGEELRGLADARDHNDIDLIYPGETFAPVESVALTHQWHEIEAKRFHHKRAYIVDDLMVEVLLAERDAEGHHIYFWSVLKHRLPRDAFDDAAESFPAVSRETLLGYRESHDLIERARP